MGFVRKHTGIDLTGGGQRRAIEQATKDQTAAGQEALQAIRGDLGPFRQFGEQALGDLGQSVLGVGAAPQLPAFSGFNVGAVPEFAGFNVSPDRVLNNPFFQALRDEGARGVVASQALSGRGSSGGTQDALARNLLLLGNQFQQQDINRQAQELGLTNQQQQLGVQRQAQEFDIRNQLAQQDFANRLQANQARFNQLFNIAGGLGQSSAAQTGAQGASILQNLGNVQAAGRIAGSQVQNPLGQAAIGAGIGALTGGAGLLGGGAGAGTGAILGALSDERLKENIKFIENIDGINWYKWDWNKEGKKIAGDQPCFGVIAQEVMKTHPSAVTMGKDGYYRVNYEELG